MVAEVVFLEADPSVQSMNHNITSITRCDYEDLCDMMIELSKFSGVKDQSRQVYNRQYAKQVLLRCEKTGASFIARDQKNHAVGMILSIRVQDLWIPDIIRLHEIGWYVRNKIENVRVGARLFQRYQESAENMIKQGKITGFTMSKIPISGNIDLEKRGFKYIQATYLKEAV